MDTPKLRTLRRAIETYISGKRLAHTLSVEAECEALAECYGMDPDSAEDLCTAALLHDITKEIKTDGQIELCRRFHISYDVCDLLSPKVFHARTAAALAACDFPDLVNDTICDAIRCHTTGRENMTLTDKLLYLADYIEPTRTWEDCVKLRERFYHDIRRIDARKCTDPSAERLAVLDRTLILSFDMTIRALLTEGSVIAVQTIVSRNALIAGQTHPRLSETAV